MTPSAAVKSIFLTKILYRIFAFGGGVILARALGKEDRGILAFVTLLITIGYPMVSISFGTGARFQLSSRRFEVSEVLWTAMAVAMTTAIAGVALMDILWVQGWLGETGMNIDSALLLLGNALLVAQAFYWILDRISLGAAHYQWTNRAEILTVLGSVCGIVILFLLGSLTVRSALASAIAGKLLACGYLAVKSFSCYKVSRAFNLPFLKHSLSYGIRAWAGNVAGTANRRLDQLILGFLATPGQLGLYVIAAGVSEFLQFGTMSIGPVLHNKIAAEKNTREKVRIFCQVHRLVMVTGLASIVFMSAIGWYGIPIVYGSEFADSRYVFLFYLPGMLAVFSVSVIRKYFSATDKVFVNSKISLYSFGVGIALYPFAIHYWGMIGAAVASSTVYLIGACWAHYFVRKELKEQCGRLFLLTREDAWWLWRRALVGRIKPRIAD